VTPDWNRLGFFLFLSMSSFNKLATIQASLKGSPGGSSGKRSTPATQIAPLSCTPLDPVQPEIGFRLGLVYISTRRMLRISPRLP
jgi:hypothetical protein